MSLHSDGFLTKSELSHLPKAVNEVLNNRRYLSEKGWEYIIGQLNEYGDLFHELFNSNLTQKEKEVIRTYIHTKSRKGVAVMTGIKEETVKRHHNSILKKLSLRRMNEVAKKFGRFF